MAEARLLTRHDDHLADLLDRPYPDGLSDKVRFDHSKQQWHIWDGHRWAPDRTNGIIELVHQRAAYWFGLDTTDGDTRKAILPIFDKSKKDTVLKTLASRPGIAMAGDEWDPDPTLLAFTNGVLSLETGEFNTTPDPSLLLSRSTRHAFNPEAECPRFIAFIKEVMGGDDDLTNYLLQVLGYALFGYQREQKFWMWVGQGQNGKGTLAKIIAFALGDYADTPSSELYMKTRFGAARSDVARPDLLRLQGVRWTWMSEPSGGQFHEELLKAHTGDDPIQARDLYGKANSFTTFRPSHTIIFLTNNPPRTEDVGTSMARRARVIKFLQDFTGEREDRGLEDTMKGEVEGILALLALAARNWLQQGFSEPALVTTWSNEYIEDNDPLAAFVAEACIQGRDLRCSASLMWVAFQDWCIKTNNEIGSQMGFGLAMNRRYRKVRTRTGYVYFGIKAMSAVDLADAGKDDDA